MVSFGTIIEPTVVTVTVFLAMLHCFGIGMGMGNGASWPTVERPGVGPSNEIALPHVHLSTYR